MTPPVKVTVRPETEIVTERSERSSRSSILKRCCRWRRARRVVAIRAITDRCHQPGDMVRLL
jgi:hypothetical protein